MPIAEPSGPLSGEELETLFASLNGARRIALAVSGGSDSLALLDCVDRWRRAGEARAEVLILSVDHGLRPSSASEARMVARVARGRGLEARILVAEGPYPQADIEAAARAARYRLLLAAARQAGASHLLLAHHRDDQAETLLLRLARGSGVFGLAAMRPEIQLGDPGSAISTPLTILRPFLDLAKARLIATAEAAGFAPVADAMNDDPRFARARIRRVMPVLAGEGIDAKGLAATARRLSGAAEALDQWASRVIAAAVTTDPLAVARLDPVALFEAPGEIRLRVLARLLQAVGGEAYPPRFERLSGLLSAMQDRSGLDRFKRTLGGAVVEARGGRFAVYREAGRDGLPTIEIGAGLAIVWDHRFRIEAGRGVPRGLSLGPLGEAGRREIGAKAADAADGALAALPAIRRKSAILSVPGLGFQAAGEVAPPVEIHSILARRLAEPSRFPDPAQPF